VAPTSASHSVYVPTTELDWGTKADKGRKKSDFHSFDSFLLSIFLQKHTHTKFKDGRCIKRPKTTSRKTSLVPEVSFSTKYM